MRKISKKKKMTSIKKFNLKNEDDLQNEDDLKTLRGLSSQTMFPFHDTFLSCNWQPNIANWNYSGLGWVGLAWSNSDFKSISASQQSWILGMAEPYIGHFSLKEPRNIRGKSLKGKRSIFLAFFR